MQKKMEGMRTIWYFVGWILSIIGFIAMVAGIWEYVAVADETIVLSHLHTNLWWGMFIAVVGFIFIYKNKDKVVEV